MEAQSACMMQHRTNHLSKGNPTLPSSLLCCIITIQLKQKTNKQKKNKQMSMKRLRSTGYSSSYHCPVSKRLDCSGWLSDWPQALAGHAGHCEGRLGNELEIGDPTIQTDFSGQKRRNKQPGWERLAGNREENSCEVMETQKDLTKGFLFHQQLQLQQVHSLPYMCSIVPLLIQLLLPLPPVLQQL